MSKFLLLSTLLLSLLVVLDWAHGGVVPKTDDAATANKESYELINYAQLRDTPHHIVKRKSKMGGRGFGFGKGKGSKSKSQNRDPYPKQPQPAQPGQNPAYPKQPAYNPNYPGGAGGAPPPYPGTNSRPGYPPAGGAPPPYPGTGAGGHYGQAPPPYPGTGHHNMPAYPPAYSGGGYGYGQPGYGGAAAGAGLGGLAGAGAGGFGGKGFGNSGGFGGMGKGGGGGLGRTLGAAGFGAVAGTALGAYGGYKLGRMVGGLGRNGHYGYYDDYGKYIRCDPPRNIKVDPETNVTYIPLDQDYDKRCSYFDRRPPSYWGGYTNGGACNLGLSSPVNRLVGGVVNWTLFSSGWNSLAQLSLAGDNVLVFALVAAVMMFR